MGVDPQYVRACINAPLCTCSVGFGLVVLIASTVGVDLRWQEWQRRSCLQWRLSRDCAAACLQTCARLSIRRPSDHTTGAYLICLFSFFLSCLFFVFCFFVFLSGTRVITRLGRTSPTQRLEAASCQPTRERHGRRAHSQLLAASCLLCSTHSPHSTGGRHPRALCLRPALSLPTRRTRQTATASNPSRTSRAMAGSRGRRPWFSRQTAPPPRNHSRKFVFKFVCLIVCFYV